MTIRHTIAAAALSTVALLSGTSLAADFASELSEAKVASQVADRDTREAVIPALNAAGSLNAWGYQSQAQDQLSFARGMLGLSTSSAIVATPVVAASSIDGTGLDAQLTEAKAALSGASREIRKAAIPALNTARSLVASGSHVEAQDYLNFVRGKLGLGAPAQIQAVKIGDIAGLAVETH